MKKGPSTRTSRRATGEWAWMSVVRENPGFLLLEDVGQGQG